MTVDMRTRVDGPAVLIDPDRFFSDDFPAALDANAEAVIPGLPFVAPRPLVVDVDDMAWTLRADGGRVTITRGAQDTKVRVRFTPEQLADLVNDQATIMSMWAGNTLDQSGGNPGHLMDWWLVLRAALDGTPMYTPGSVSLNDVDGKPLDLHRAFRPDDDPAVMHHFLETAGFLHISGLFTEDEMNAISADMDRAVSTYEQGDGKSWWARTADGDAESVWRCVRMQGFSNHSEGAASILKDERFVAISKIPQAGHTYRKSRAHNRIEALFKPIGVTEGISDIPWHKDCGIGRHSYDCCGLTVGISVTGADAVSGQLWAMAGSHRALVWSGVKQPDLDLPEIPLATKTGDVTVHLSCTMHMAQPPTERERRVMYSGFGLPPLAEANDELIAANRARLGNVRETAPLTVLDKHFKS
jgi:hypothetical protein